MAGVQCSAKLLGSSDFSSVTSLRSVMNSSSNSDDPILPISSRSPLMRANR